MIALLGGVALSTTFSMFVAIGAGIRLAGEIERLKSKNRELRARLAEIDEIVVPIRIHPLSGGDRARGRRCAEGA